MSCDSSKCDLKRSYAIPNDEQEETPEDRQLALDIAIDYTPERCKAAQVWADFMFGADGKRLQRLMAAGLINGCGEAKQP